MKPKRNVWLMYAVALLQGMVFYGPIATLYRQAAGVSIFQIGIIESASLALCLLLELPWGAVADKIGYKKTMILCYGLYFISKIIFWRAESFGAFLVERLLLSVVMAGLSDVDTSVLYLSCKEGSSQKVFGIYNNLQTTGLLFAAMIYSVFIKDDYRLAGLLTVISYGAAALLTLVLAEVRAGNDAKPCPKDFLRLLRQTLGNKRLLLFLVGVALLNETHQTVTVFLNQLQYVRCGLSASAIGYIYIGVTLVGLFGVFSAGLTRRLGTLRFTSVLFGTAAACVVLAAVKSAWLSVAAVMLLRISFSLFQPLQTELQNRQVKTHNRATELSIYALIIDSLGIGTNLIYGKLADADISAALYTGATLCLIGFLCFCIWELKGGAGIKQGQSTARRPGA